MPNRRNAMVGIPVDAVYCPGPDQEMESSFASMQYAFGGDIWPCLLSGGSKQLGNMRKDNKLYILCHGNSSLPLFQTKAGTWTAKQMAKMISDDGLSKQHREIELLVCHAGESVTDKKAAAKREVVYQKFLSAKANQNESGKVKYSNKVAAIKGAAPSEFNSSNQTLPLGAGLMQEMKSLGYADLRVICYACPVAKYNPDKNIYLDLQDKVINGAAGRWGVKASSYPQFRKVWL